MRPIIEFCASNAGHGTDRLRIKLEQNPEYDVIEYGCLNNCGQCYLAPFAMVEGEIVEAETAEELEAAIDAKIKELEEWFNIDLK
ncbi:UDP-N-acetylmuramoylalanine--D-glutamate ligase [Bacillus sp. FJAT-27264]|uniref:YuzB family protein n=1 Tax=Paenibacillus sp. (strain DSM 101736 / FJAT-27264) TaxID=1850362 RepID=UPI000807AE4A|nr:YuzB family protein [Bacillus sp. FJAT-27264]OBZ09637.1 UDP-N-acetylmuramoylalanine--D-glutamate ligase [Bacillus sp. FJAT-27264]